MRKNLLRICNSTTLSLLLLVLPYFIKIFQSLYNSFYFSWLYFLITILFLFPLQLIFFYSIESKKKLLQILALLFYCFLLITLYGRDILNFTNNIQNRIYGIQFLRGREQLFIFSGLFFYSFQFFYFRVPQFFRYVNLFFLFFSFIVLSNQLIIIHRSSNGVFLNEYKSVNITKEKSKPVLLIILDEYSSPIELSKLQGARNLNSFTNHLKKIGFSIKEKFYSNETSTINSLGSLFNFNLSSNESFSKTELNSLIKNQFINSLLADSLEKKNVKVINYGIFNLGKSFPLSRIYNYPISYFESLMANSIISQLKFGNIENLNELSLNFYPTEKHNKTVYENLNKLELSEKKSFIYAHLVMPHGPFTFYDEFKYKPPSTSNYLPFWNFTNLKIYPVLENLIASNAYKIILTGDHGFRGYKIIDPHYTFAAFFGFEESSLSDVNSFQDLGSLINAQFE